MIQSDDIMPVGGKVDSDEEYEDGNQVEEPSGCEDHSFLIKMMEDFVQSISIVNTRAGRAALVHNFLRGLELMADPDSSGESALLIICWKQLIS